MNMQRTRKDQMVEATQFDVKSLVHIENLNKTFSQGNNHIPALKKLALTVDSGEFVAVMGASGSGKSTLLHILAGLLKPDNDAKVTIFGQNFAQLKEKAVTAFRLENIGIIYQNYNLVRSLNVKENIRLPLLLLKNSQKKEQKINALIEKLGLTHRTHHLPRQLSGGEQQRVAIGRALITEPKLILADEPTGNLDISAGVHICSILKSSKQEMGHTIIMVTHEPHIAFQADRIIMLAEGRIVSDVKKDQFEDSVELSVHYQKILQQNVNTSRQGTLQ